MNQHIFGILLHELKVIPRSSRPIANLKTCLKTAHYIVAMDSFYTFQMTARDDDVNFAKEIRLKTKSATIATVVSTTRGLLEFEPSTALVLRQRLPAIGIIEVMPNIPFRILLTNVSDQHVHVPKHMIMVKLCTNLTTIIVLNQLSTTTTEDLTLARAVSIVQGDDENMSLPKRTKFQAPEQWRSYVNIPH